MLAQEQIAYSVLLLALNPTSWANPTHGQEVRGL